MDDGRCRVVASEPLDPHTPRRLALLRPTLVVVDPARDGRLDLPFVQMLRLAVPRGRVVVRTSLIDHTAVRPLLDLGVCGYLVPGLTPGPWLCSTLELIGRTGSAVLAPSVAAALCNAALGQAVLTPAPALPPPLSDRDQAILRRLAEGIPCAEIAADLGISERQLRRDTAALRRRLGAHSLRHLAARARELDDHRSSSLQS